MPTPSLWINPANPDWQKSLASLPPTPGCCVFIDIAGSTAMKQHGLLRWIAPIYNLFSNAGLFLDPFSPIKAIGDELLFFIEASDLQRSRYTPLQVFDGLWQISRESSLDFPDVRIGATWCDQAYSITFLRGNQDYYGIDVDLTARLRALASERQVVIERRFYDRVAAEYQKSGNKEQFPSYRSFLARRARS